MIPNGMLGKAVTAFVRGNEERDQANRDVVDAVQNFNSALSHFGHGVGFQTYEEVKSISSNVKRILSIFNLVVNTKKFVKISINC